MLRWIGIALLNITGGVVAVANGGVVWRLPKRRITAGLSSQVANSAIKAITVDLNGNVFAGSEGDGSIAQRSRCDVDTNDCRTREFMIESFSGERRRRCICGNKRRRIFRTTNMAWTGFRRMSVWQINPVDSIVLAPGGELYAGTPWRWACLKSDNGITWTQTGLRMHITALAVSTRRYFCRVWNGTIVTFIRRRSTWVQTGYKGLNIIRSIQYG